MELIHKRLKEEFDRLGLKAAAAAKYAGEEDSQGLRDVLGGRKRLSAELLAALAPTGVDLVYVLTGTKTILNLPADEQMILSRYRNSAPELKDAALRVLLGGDTTQTTRYEGSHMDFKQAPTGTIVGGDFVIGNKRK
ncbi:hypothetical protein ACFQNF_05690 [Iodobacter arcticus]|uniref:Transcriptional regulator n=1 Tax=Iodobacter arcticus TaxID=590593 RepID=A0ABW2QUH6_9NEIS